MTECYDSIATLRAVPHPGANPDAVRALSSAGERCLHTAEVTGSIPVAPTRRIPRSAGVFLCQASFCVSPFWVPRAHRVHIRFAPGRLEGVGGVPVEAFGEVAVDVEDGLDAGMSEAGRDDRRVCALLDEEGDVAVAKVMESHRRADRVGDGGEPESAAVSVAADGSSFWCGEDQAVRARPDRC